MPRKLFHRLRLHLRRNKAEREMEAELRFHLEMATKENLRRGMTAEEAQHAARLSFGGVEQVKEACRDVRRLRWVEDVWQDLHYGVRNLREHALLSVVVITMLTLGIGVSTGVFAFLNAGLLRPQVDKDFDAFARIYTAYTTDPARPSNLSEDENAGTVTLEDYLAFRDQTKLLHHLAAWAEARVSLDEDKSEEASGLLVTSNFFALYDQEQPLLGRLLQPEDYSDARPLVVLSESLWRKQLGADPQIVGKVVRFNGQPVTVVGVMPTFHTIEAETQAWFPYTLASYLKQSDHLLKPDQAWLRMVGRLNPGVTRQDVAAELRSLAAQQDHLHPGRSTSLVVTDGSTIQHPALHDRGMLGFSLAMGALTIFVLIVCVNVTTLLLARAATRRQEVVVRLALGAGRRRLVRMLLTETFLLAALAGLLSLYLTYHFPSILMWYLRDPLPWLLTPDWRVFGYLTLVTLLAGTTTGLAPALESLKVNLSEMLKGRRSALGSASCGSRLHGLLIGTQIALSFLLLVFACVFARTYQKAMTFDPGFEARQVLHARLRLSGKSSWVMQKDSILARLAASPGVQSVAYASTFDSRDEIALQIPGQAIRQVSMSVVSSNFFTTMGIPTARGRALQESDLPCGENGCHVVISERCAREFWPDENPLGQVLRTPEAPGLIFEVVGVVRDIASQQVGKLDQAMIYLPWEPRLAPAVPGLLLRFSGDEASLARAVNASVREIEPKLSLWTQTLQVERDRLLARFASIGQTIVLLVTFTVSLALIGIYGMVAFAVNQRAKEMGIRIALGAGKKDIYHAVLGASGRPVAIGLLIGLVISWGTTSAAARFFQSRTYSLDTSDPLTYALAGILLAVAALVAMLIPARRATQIDPMAALRCE